MTEPQVSARRSGLRARRGALLLAIAALGVLAMAAMLALGGGAPHPSPLGIPDPGPLTGWGLPIMQALSNLLAVAVIGTLIVAPLTMTTTASELSNPAVRALAMVRRLATVWFVVCLVEIWLTVSDLFAVPPTHLALGAVVDFATSIDQGRLLLVQLLLVAMVAVGCRWALTNGEACAVLGLSVLAVIPPVFTGHSASAGSHDLAVVSLLVHVLAVVFWVGGVVALWWHLGASRQLRTRAVRRFSGLAVWCFALTGVSGAVNALVRLGGVTELFTSRYGGGVLAKIAAFAVLGLLAARLRAMVRSREAGLTDSRLFGMLTGAELVVMSTAIGLGVGLSRTPPPVGATYTTLSESLLGGPLPPAPDLARVLWGFTPSGVGLAVCGLGATFYLTGVITLRRHGHRWPIWRTLMWLIGLVFVGYATFGGLGVYSHVLFSLHMVSHMMLSMVAPILLVLGAPVTLALRALPGADTPGGTGPRQLLARVLASRPVRLLTNAGVAAAIFIGSLYVVYLTPVFDKLMLNHLGHAFMQLHFLLAGVLFYEVLIGSAPLPRRLPYLGRVLLLLLVMPLHAFFAISVMSSQNLIGGDYYRLLDRPYSTDLAADQYLAGAITWALSEVPIVILFLVMLIQWYRQDSRAADRYDRRAERDNDAELAAYNQHLQELARRDAEEPRTRLTD